MLPPGNDFAAWLHESLLFAKSRLGVDIDLWIVLYAEPWPCETAAWSTFWDSKLMSDANLRPYVERTYFTNPPVKCFLKAGLSGVTLVKRIVLVHMTNRMHEGLDSDAPERLRSSVTWRRELVPSFLQQERLYIEVLRSDGRRCKGRWMIFAFITTS